MNRLRDESGSILLAALAILALLVIVLTGMIAYGSWHKARCLLVLNRVKATYLAEAGVQHALAIINAGSDLQSRSGNISTPAGSFDFAIRPWGGYLMIDSKGSTARAEEKISAQVGQFAPPIFESALSLIGPPYPLTVAGNARIRGDVQLGPAGVSAGELHGQRYTGDSLVYGSVRSLQAEQIPHFSDNLITQFLDSIEIIERSCGSSDLSLIVKSPIKGVAADRECQHTSAEIVFDLDDSTTMTGPQYFFCGGELTVTGKSRLTQMVLKSSKSILVDGNARLTDCILISPSVTITDQAEVAGQVFADSAVAVEGQARLADMTLVYLIGKQKDDAIDGLVRIGSRRVSDACLVFHGGERAPLSSSKKAKPSGRIRIDPGSAVNGIVWSDGYLEMLGVLRGAAVASQLYYYDSPTLYLDWLVDGRLESTTEVSSWVVPLLFGQSRRLEFKKIGPGA